MTRRSTTGVQRQKRLALITDEHMRRRDYVIAHVGYSLADIKRTVRQFGFDLESRADGSFRLSVGVGVYTPVQRDTKGRVYFRYRSEKPKRTIEEIDREAEKIASRKEKPRNSLKTKGKSGSKETGHAQAEKINLRKQANETYRR